MGRFGNARKQVDFSLMVGAHFDRDKVRLGWSIQQGERYPDVVVQIAFCGMHIHPLSQHIANQLFGRGFAVASSHPQHGAIPTSPVGPGEALQGFQFLGNHGDFGMASPLRICGDGMGRSLIEGALNKCIAVKVCAAKCEKDMSIQVLSRVRGKSFGGVSGFKQAVDGVGCEVEHLACVPHKEKPHGNAAGFKFFKLLTGAWGIAPSLSAEWNRCAHPVHGASEADGRRTLALIQVPSGARNEVIGSVIPAATFVHSAAVADQCGTTKVVYALVFQLVFFRALGAKIE